MRRQQGTDVIRAHVIQAKQGAWHSPLLRSPRAPRATETTAVVARVLAKSAPPLPRRHLPVVAQPSLCAHARPCSAKPPQTCIVSEGFVNVVTYVHRDPPDFSPLPESLVNATIKSPSGSVLLVKAGTTFVKTFEPYGDFVGKVIRR